MDYSIFKPGDKVRGTEGYEGITGTVLFSNAKCILVERVRDLIPGLYSRTKFEKLPQRTSKFRNVYLNDRNSLFVSYVSENTRKNAFDARSRLTSYIGTFEQVFENGKLVDTIYHPDSK